MRFTEYLTEEEVTEMTGSKLFGRFRRKKPVPDLAATTKPTKPRDPEESPRRRFLRRLDESYRFIARLASHAYDADVDKETLMEEFGEIVDAMYERKIERAERKKRGEGFHGEEKPQPYAKENR